MKRLLNQKFYWPLLKTTCILLLLVACHNDTDSVLPLPETELTSQRPSKNEAFQINEFKKTIEFASLYNLKHRIEYYQYKTGLGYLELKRFAFIETKHQELLDRITNSGLNPALVAYDLHFMHYTISQIKQSYPDILASKKMKKIIAKEVDSISKMLVKEMRNKEKNKKPTLVLGKHIILFGEPCLEGFMDCEHGLYCVRVFGGNEQICWHSPDSEGSEGFVGGALDEVVITAPGSSTDYGTWDPNLDNRAPEDNTITYSSSYPFYSAGGTNPELDEDPNLDCPQGFIKDALGNCKKIPCKGDPVPNPDIAPQKNSGLMGGTFGCTRFGGICKGYPGGRSKAHEGIDIKSSFGDPIYAMFDGFIYTSKYDPAGAGYYTRIQSTVNGKTFIHEYFHLQQNNRITTNANGSLRYVKAGDVIGFLGHSGNLKDAIKNGTTESHVHIKISEHNGSNKWGYGNFTPVDPISYFSSTIDVKTGKSNKNCN